MPNSKIFITGGAGFIGSVLTGMLLERGYRVRILDKLIYGNGATLLPYFVDKNFEFFEGDVRDETLVRELMRDCDGVVHLAAIVGYPACRKDERFATETNVGGTKNVVSNLSPNQALIHASTGSNYGAIGGLCTEETPLAPLSVYGQTKTEAEKIVRDKPNAIIYRFATGFGISPRIRLDLMINDFVYQAIHTKNLVVYEKDFRRTFIHVKDMAASILFAIGNFEAMKGQVFNVGSKDMNLTKEDIAQKILQHIQFYVYLGAGKDEDQRDYEVSYNKISNLGFQAKVSLDDGIRELVNGLRHVKIKNPYSNV